MIFSTNFFLFIFLPVFLLMYYLTPEEKRSWTILIGSYSFYAWWRVDFLGLFMAVTLWNYLFGIKIAKAEFKSKAAKRLLAIGICGNLLTLAYFKYANFGVDTVNAVMSELGLDAWLVTHVILPIGISFYIFQAISYIIDVYRHDTPATKNLIDFAAFIALFPQLIAGPVLRYKDIADQFTKRNHSLEKFSLGLQRFMLGFVKKVFIADSIAPLVDKGFLLESPTTADAWLSVFAYSAQLYFDFSGYADMAIGLGLMMGFRFCENFNQPYVSQSITEFWRRWHISLSSWLRDYLYISLGGNRGSKLKTYRNLLLTMLLGGLWHGANWTFIIWGAWHGGILATEKALNLNVKGNGLNLVKWSITLLLVMIGWVVFRADSVSSAFTLYVSMFTNSGLELSSAYLNEITKLQLSMLALAWILIISCGVYTKLDNSKKSLSRFSAVFATLLLPIFILSIFKLSAQSYSAFLYFQF